MKEYEQTNIICPVSMNKKGNLEGEARNFLPPPPEIFRGKSLPPPSDFMKIFGIFCIYLGRIELKVCALEKKYQPILAEACCFP